jgi:hypothetical protein
MKKLLVIFLIGVPLLLFLQCSSPFEPEVKEFADPENEILREVNANQIPWLVAWVVKDDSMVWQKYYGYAEVSSRKVALMVVSNYRHDSVYPGNKIHALVRRIAKKYE